MDKAEYRYWIIDDGLRKGPYSHDEVMAMMLGGDTPVWREGLGNWIAIKELDDFGVRYNEDIPPVPDVNATRFDEVGSTTPEIPYVRISEGGVSGEKEPMPQTYLPWAIVTMLFCCLIPGIITLIYSFKVSSRYNAGDYEGARKASDTTAVWLMVTIVCGLIAIPFQFLCLFL